MHTSLVYVCPNSYMDLAYTRKLCIIYLESKCNWGDFPGGTVVKNPPANAGDTGSIPGPGRSHMHRATKPMRHNYWACALELLSHNYWACALEPTSHNYWAHMPQLLRPTHLEPVLCKKGSHHNEKPAQSNEE